MNIINLADIVLVWLAAQLLRLTDFFGIGKEAVVWFYTICPGIALVFVGLQFPDPHKQYYLVVTEFFLLIPLSVFWTWKGLKALKNLGSGRTEQLLLPDLWLFDPNQRLAFLIMAGVLPVMFAISFPHSIAWLAIILPRGFQFYLLANYNSSLGVRLKDLVKVGLERAKRAFVPRVPDPVPVPAS